MLDDINKMEFEIEKIELALQQAILTLNSSSRDSENIIKQLEEHNIISYEMAEHELFRLRGKVNLQVIPHLKSNIVQARIIMGGYHKIFEDIKHVLDELNSWSQTKESGNTESSSKEQ